jgi:hypothetical protein
MSRGLLIIDKTPGGGHIPSWPTLPMSISARIASCPRCHTTLEQKRLHGLLDASEDAILAIALNP